MPTIHVLCYKNASRIFWPERPNAVQASLLLSLMATRGAILTSKDMHITAGLVHCRPHLCQLRALVDLVRLLTSTAELAKFPLH